MSGLLLDKIIRTGDNNANIQTGTRALTSDAIYRENPTALFHQLCGARPATLLLESLTSTAKMTKKSLLLVDSALRITALVTLSLFRPSPPTARRCWNYWTARCPPGINNQRQPNGRILTFPAVSALLDEDARLCSLSVFDAFRLLQELVSVPDNEREAMFFGGLFAYDLVAGFEDLPQLQSDTACPDYCFYLAETPAGHRPSGPSIPAFRPACSPRWGVKNSAWSSA